MRLRPPPLACTTVAEAVGWARGCDMAEAFRLPEDDPHQILRVARGTDYLGLLSARREARAKAEAEGDDAQVVKVEAAFRTFVDGAEKRFKEAVDTAPDDAAALYMVPALPCSLPPRLHVQSNRTACTNAPSGVSPSLSDTPSLRCSVSLAGPSDSAGDAGGCAAALQYANFLQTIESFDEAEQLYRRTLEADPTNADALNNLVCEPRLFDLRTVYNASFFSTIDYIVICSA